jgi:hypothetical protein
VVTVFSTTLTPALTRRLVLPFFYLFFSFSVSNFVKLLASNLSKIVALQDPEIKFHVLLVWRYLVRGLVLCIV